jgi:hypothetical protein
MFPNTFSRRTVSPFTSGQGVRWRRRPVLAWLHALLKVNGQSWLLYNVQSHTQIWRTEYPHWCVASRTGRQKLRQKPLPLPSKVCGRCVVPPVAGVWYVYPCSRGKYMSPAGPDLPRQYLPGIQSCRVAGHLAEWVLPVPLCTAFQLLSPPETLHPPSWHRLCHLLDEAL